MTSMRVALLAILGLGLICCAKEEPTEYAKGKDEAAKKLDYAKGAGEVLHAQGGAVGRTAGDGVGSLLRGIGTGMVDVVYPPVKVNATPELAAAGITVNKCTEGSGSDVELTAAFSKVYKGRIQMKAFDKGNIELGRAESKTINQPPASLLNVTFSFPSAMRLSDIAHVELVLLATAPVTIVDAAAPAAERSEAPISTDTGLSLGQMQEQDTVPPKVSIYVIFEREFKGSIQMRAYDATDTEIGRSPKMEDVAYAADTSDTLEFSFNAEIDRASIARYTLNIERRGAKAKKGKKR